MALGYLLIIKLSNQLMACGYWLYTNYQIKKSANYLYYIVRFIFFSKQEE